MALIFVSLDWAERGCTQVRLNKGSWHRKQSHGRGRTTLGTELSWRPLSPTGGPMSSFPSSFIQQVVTLCLPPGAALCWALGPHQLSPSLPSQVL